MKTIKLYDAWIQLIQITIFIIFSLTTRGNGFLIGYFVVGGYQVLNTILHALYKYTSGSKYRHYYNLTLIYIGVVVGIAFLIPSLLFIVGYLLLFISPFLAVTYNAICFYEVKKMYERPLAQLK